MSVSPLMGPILSMTFGVAINKGEMIKRGLRNEAAGVIVSLLTGLIMGFCASPFITSDFESAEMESRGKCECTSLIFLFLSLSSFIHSFFSHTDHLASDQSHHGIHRGCSFWRGCDPGCV